MRTYQETLDYLFQQLPMYQRQGKAAYKANLDNIIELTARLGNPHLKFKSIHVAGTNGKGSTSHMLASVFQAHGYKTGLYTSPHLLDFRERVKINGEVIPQEDVISFVEANEEKLKDLRPSFFEWSVALAFHHFAHQQVDIAIIEVGLGGRLDATNIIHPELSVITNIGFDHTQFLGDKEELIAAEKGGIIKLNTPVVIGEYTDKTKPVFERIANEKQAPIQFVDQNTEIEYQTDLKGLYQAKNILTVQTALKVLTEDWNLNKTQIQGGLNAVVKNTGLRGRWETIQKEPLIIADVGHNKEGLAYNMTQLKKIQRGELKILLGFVNDKNIDSVLEILPKEAEYWVCQAQIERAMDATELYNKLIHKGFNCKLFTDSIFEILKGETKKLNPANTLYIGGSTFVVAESLDFFSKSLAS